MTRTALASDGSRSTPVSYSTNHSWKRWFATLLIESQFLFLLTALSLYSMPRASYSTYLDIIGTLLVLIWLYLWFATPNLMRLTLGGKFVDVQAALFGFEGLPQRADRRARHLGRQLWLAQLVGEREPSEQVVCQWVWRACRNGSHQRRGCHPRDRVDENFHAGGYHTTWR